jgi:hypothetical protein
MKKAVMLAALLVLTTVALALRALHHGRAGGGLDHDQ